MAGAPKSVMLTCLSAEARILRVRRSAHESRTCACCVRERIEGEGTERLWLDGSNACFTSQRDCVPPDFLGVVETDQEAGADAPEPVGDRAHYILCHE